MSEGERGDLQVEIAGTTAEIRAGFGAALRDAQRGLEAARARGASASEIADLQDAVEMLAHDAETICGMDL